MFDRIATGFKVGTRILGDIRTDFGVKIITTRRRLAREDLYREFTDRQIIDFCRKTLIQNQEVVLEDGGIIKLRDLEGWYQASGELIEGILKGMRKARQADPARYSDRPRPFWPW